MVASSTTSKSNENLDRYGELEIMETPQLLTSSMEKLHQLLEERRAEEETSAWILAQERCPNLTGNDHKLMFLRSEKFDVELCNLSMKNSMLLFFLFFLIVLIDILLVVGMLAAARLFRFWTARVSLFGEDKAFLPNTLNGAFADDEAAISTGMYRLSDKLRDIDGRSILLVDASKADPKLYSRESLTRVMWYMILVALEDIETQQQGIVFMVDPRSTGLSHFDRVQAQRNVESIQNLLPMRLSCMHIVGPPPVWTVILKFLRFIMGPAMRNRLVVHSAKSQEKLLSLLEQYGIPKSCAPDTFGGDVHMDHGEWMMRRINEEK